MFIFKPRQAVTLAIGNVSSFSSYLYYFSYLLLLCYSASSCRRLCKRWFKLSVFFSIFHISFSSYGRVSMIRVRHNKKMVTEGLFFYHINLLCCLDQMLAVMKLSQHLVSSSKTVRPNTPRGARCMSHVKIM